MAKTTVKSYLKAREESSFAPFIIELEQGEFLEIPSSNTLPNSFKTSFGRLNLRMQELNHGKTKNKYDDKQISNVEDIYHLVNENIELFRMIDEKYGSTIWWMVFKDWAEFSAEQLKVSDQGK